MADAPQMFKDSYAPVQVEIRYQPNPYGGGTIIQLPAYDVLVSFSAEYAASTGWTGCLVLYDPQEQFTTAAMFPGKGARFMIRFYWDNVASSAAAAPVFRGNVTQIVADYEYNATKVTIDLSADQVSNASLDVNLPPRTFPSGMLASEIAAKLAAAAWPGTATVIEQTKNVIPHGFNLGNQSHWQFVQKTLLPNARNDKGDDFLAFFDPVDETFHFHSAKYVARREPATRHYVYARDTVGEVVSFTPKDNTFFTASQGGQEAAFVSAHSKAGTYIEQVSTNAKGVKEPGKAAGEQYDKYGNHPTTWQGENASPSMTAGGNSSPGGAQAAKPQQAYVPLVARTPEEAANYATAYYSLLKSRSYQASLTVKGTHDMRVMKTPVRVDYYATESDQPHYLSGIFDVVKVRQTLDSGGWKTEADLSRKGVPSSAGGQASLMTGDKVKPPPLTA